MTTMTHDDDDDDDDDLSMPTSHPSWPADIS